MAEPVTRSAVLLGASSALGSVSAQTPKQILDTADLLIIEEPFLNLTSLRSSRILPGADAGAALAAWGLKAPARAYGLDGSAGHGCAWIEPRAWMVSSALPPVSWPAVAGVLCTDISDRYAIFRINGAAAADVIAAGCDPAIVPAGCAARTRFASLATVLIQRWSGDDFRILVDVSIGATFAQWLRQTGANVTRGG